ncbi:carbohydrate esterase family 9 protein [Paxillus involutus ATCC 200175]|uniref:Carbohydrate esterase family 9 protein n=1 Tax=Paxillus involutus ATCC 200175 TaxID=664439 RepID=A0A0C9TYX1_PAXIN|nr:carbohydrate esterase family 9 protein [Paxillus involutus ATCC 200175]
MASSIWKSAQDLMKHDERLFVIPGGYGSWKWEWQSMEVHESAESSTTSSTAAITPTSLWSRQSSQTMKILDPHLKDGIHEWCDGRRFYKEGDKFYLEDGQRNSLDKCVRNFARFTGCSLGEAIKCATFNPAKCLGIENKKGSLRAGADADLIVLNRQGEVLRLGTWEKGKLVWEKK